MLMVATVSKVLDIDNRQQGRDFFYISLFYLDETYRQHYYCTNRTAS